MSIPFHSLIRLTNKKWFHMWSCMVDYKRMVVVVYCIYRIETMNQNIIMVNSNTFIYKNEIYLIYNLYADIKPKTGNNRSHFIFLVNELLLILSFLVSRFLIIQPLNILLVDNVNKIIQR